MSGSDALLQTLHAYHDGELGWWGRHRFERELSRSAELREELDSLRLLSSLASESEAERVLPAGAVWEGIEGRLRAVDASLESAGAVAAESPAASWLAWRPFAAAAVAVGALALFLVLQPATGPVVDTATVGALRYLDAGDRSVMVQDREDVTIIWVMDGADDV